MSDGDARAIHSIKSLLRRFDGEGPGRWTFEGKPISDEAAHPLLILTDEMNHYGEHYGKRYA